MKTIKRALFTLCLLALGIGSAFALTGNDVWTSYDADPDSHTNIPNNSYSGYHNGNIPIPTVPVVTDLVANHGGNGNGSADNTAAFKSAIAFAKSKGGGAIFIPAGTYNINGVVHLNGNGVVLRGAGSGSTTIRMTRNLKSSLWTWVAPAGNNWSWSGGALWLSPDDAFGSNGRLTRQDGSAGATSDHSDRYEQWKSGGAGTNYSGPRLAKMTADTPRGSFTIPVDSTANLSEGQFVLMTWKNVTDNSLLKHMAGHSLMASFPWTTAKSGKILSPILPRYRWPVQIKSLTANSVTLVQPTRIDAKVSWDVDFQPIGKYLQEAGVENLRVTTTTTSAVAHHEESWNCIYINRAVNTWVRNVVLHNCENGLINAETKNVTTDQVTVSGTFTAHHPFAVRHEVADILNTNFNVSTKALHGVNVEKMASGVVYSNGTLDGTLDSHKQMPFDVIRTNITMKNNGNPGGAGDAGPRLGRNIVHWNIANSGSGSNVNQSDLHSFGGLIGVRGSSSSACGESMVCGNKGHITADAGVVPAITNLHLRQLDKRKAENNWVEITNLFDTGKATGPNVVVNVSTNAKSGASVDRVEFLADGGVAATDTGSPYSATLNLSPGVHTLRARLVDSLGGSELSPPIKVTVEGGGIPTAVLSATPAERTVTAGTPSTVTYSVSASGGTASVNLNVSGAPSGSTATLNPTTISGTGASSSTLEVATDATTPQGVHTLTVSGTDTGSGNAVTPKTVSLNVQGTTPTCVTATSNNAWNNNAMASQAGSFTAQFDVTPSAKPLNAVVGLSQGAASAYTGVAAMVRFSNVNGGFIDARNGGGFIASTIPYTAGVTYHFRLVVNVATHTYSAFVTPAGQSEITIGTNMAFRTEQAGVASLNNWVANANSSNAGSINVCSFAAGP